MILFPCLIVDPTDGRVFGYTSVSIHHVAARLEGHRRGHCKTVFAVIHPNDPVFSDSTHVQLVNCLLVVPLEHLDKS